MYIINMKHEHGAAATGNRAMVYSMKAGMVTFDDGFRIEFTPALPGWIANRQAHDIRTALETGTLDATKFDAFRIPAAVNSIV